MDYLYLIYRRRFFVALVGLASCAIGILAALAQKPAWISEARLLPSDSKNESSGFAGLAALAGISVSQSASPETYYPEIIQSNDFLDTIVEMGWKTKSWPEKPRTIAEMYKLTPDTTKPDWRERERQRLRLFIRKKKMIQFERDPSGLMTLTCETIDPLFSYELNTFLLARLDTYNRVRKKTRASEKKALIEQRLHEVESALRQSEDYVRAFREKNLSVSTPALLLEQQRLMREVEVNGAVYQELRKQYEIAKIEVVDNTQILNLLEQPEIPAIAAKSIRRKLVLISTLLGLFAGAAIALAHAKWMEFRKSRIVT